MQRRIFMSSPELFISRVRATGEMGRSGGRQGGKRQGNRGYPWSRGNLEPPGVEALRGRPEKRHPPERRRGIGETRARRAAKGGERGVLAGGREAKTRNETADCR